MYQVISFDLNNGIAASGIIPWNVPEDLSHFLVLTKTAPNGQKNAVIMGARTWNTTPYFNDRINIVLTTGKTPLIIKSSTPYRVNSLKSAQKLAQDLDVFRIFIIGGAQVIKEAKNSSGVEGSFITRVEADFSCDTFLDDNFDPDDDLISLPFISNNIPVKFVYQGNPDLYQKKEEWKYLNLLWNVIKNGEIRQTRNGQTRSIFSADLSFPLDRFPLLTTKKMFLTGILEELLFFLRGETNTQKLSEKGVHIWEANTNQEFLDKLELNYSQGEMGPMYGYQWRSYNKPFQSSEGGIDTLANLIENLCTDPNSRRHIITTLNMNQVNEGVLWPCHGLVIQFYVSGDSKLSCKMYQRSADIFLGMPFNIASYAALVHVISKIVTNRGYPMTPGNLYLSFGDVHIYESHIQPAIQQLIRPPFDFPIMKLNTNAIQVEDLTVDDFQLSEYTCYPKISAPIVA